VERARFEENDIHVHVPAGGQPKEGPSAGGTGLTAMASILSGVPGRGDPAVAGGVNLRGKGPPGGGPKGEEVGGRRAGVRRGESAGADREAERGGPGRCPGGPAAGPGGRAGGVDRRRAAGGAAGPEGGRGLTARRRPFRAFRRSSERERIVVPAATTPAVGAA